jgi:hypothetical protein
MTTSLTFLARRIVLAAKTSPRSASFFKCMSSSNEKLPLPPEEYVDGHLKTDQLEFLDDMIAKTVEIEETMEALKETYGKKKHAYTNVGFMESAEIDRLFETAASQKEDLSEKISLLKEVMQEAKRTFAVDAPDGLPDARIKEEMAEINHIIQDAAEHEDRDKIEYQHKMDNAVRKDRARDPEHDW